MGMFDFKFKNPLEAAKDTALDYGKKATLFTGLFASSLGALKAETGGELLKYSPEEAKEYAAKLEVAGDASYKFTTGKEVAFSSANGYVYTETENGVVTIFVDSDKDGDLDKVTHKNKEGNYEDDFTTAEYTTDQYGKVTLKDQAQEVYINGLKTVLTLKERQAQKAAQAANAETPSVTL